MKKNTIFSIGIPLTVAVLSGAALIFFKINPIQEPVQELPEPEPLEKMIQADPEYIESMYLAAQQEFIAGNFEKAETIYKDILLQEKTARAWHALGDVHLMMLQFNEAISDFQKALKFDPKKRMTVMRLGQACQRAGKFLEAVEAYHKAQELQPDDPLAFSLEAEVLTPLGRLDEAIDRYEKSVSLQQDKVKKAAAYKSMGELALRQSRYRRAFEFFSKAAEETPQPEFYAEAAEALLKDNDLPGTRDAYRKAAELEKKDPFYWEAVAEVELRLGNTKAAREAFMESVAVKDRASIQLALARMDLAEGNADEAKSRLDNALSITEGISQDIFDAAYLAAQLKDFALAEKLLMTLDGADDVPDQTSLWGQIAVLRQDNGGDAEAVQKACAMAAQKFEDGLKPFQKRVFDAMKKVAEADADSPLPDTVTADDVITMTQKCSALLQKLHSSSVSAKVIEGKHEDEKQLAARSDLAEQLVKTCERAQSLQKILMEKEPKHDLVLNELSDLSFYTTELPKVPPCPPSSVPWKNSGMGQPASSPETKP